MAYTFAETKIRPETFIPYVGAFVGGADTKATSVAFRFDDRGILVASTTATPAKEPTSALQVDEVAKTQMPMTAAWLAAQGSAGPVGSGDRSECCSITRADRCMTA